VEKSGKINNLEKNQTVDGKMKKNKSSRNRMGRADWIGLAQVMNKFLILVIVVIKLQFH
jgi:hypothetical protein